MILFSILISLCLLLETLIFGNLNTLSRHDSAKPSGGAEMEEEESSLEVSHKLIFVLVHCNDTEPFWCQ